MSASRVEGSYRDPRGAVYRTGNRVFRTISSAAAKEFSAIESSGLLTELIEAGRLVAYQDAPEGSLDVKDNGISRILELEKLPFVSWPYEWSFRGLQCAALAHLDLQLDLLDRNFALSDASVYNVQFLGPRPVFIDHLSFRPYQEGEFWSGHRQFCEQFLNPLLLAARLGIPHNDWLRGSMEGLSSAHIAAILPWRDRLKPALLTNLYLPVWFERRRRSNTQVSKAMVGRRLPRQSLRGMLRGLRNLVEKLAPASNSTTWMDYAENTSYSDEETARKKKFVSEFVAKAKPSVLWDIGCNTGEYSELALGAGANMVIGFESDSGALELAFKRATEKKLNLLPLHIDVANPTPSQGWAQTEREGLGERRNADGLLALALIHHLCIGRNVPLPQAIDWLVSLAPQGVIEFVPKSDQMVQELLRLREDIFADYDEATFLAALTARTRVVRAEQITESGRQLVWFCRD